MKLVISTLALALGGGAALWAPLAAAPCDPQKPTTAPQCTEESQVVEVEPASFALLPGLSQEPDAEARRELEQARREIERALAQAERERAELEKELAREMEHVQREVQRAQVEGQREAERAMREAQRARQEGQREAQRAMLEAQRVAEQLHREALRVREEALRAAAEARGGLVVARGRNSASGQDRSERERRLEERIALLEGELARARRAPPAAQAGRGSAPQPAAPLARRLTIRRGDASGGIVQREPSARSAPQPDSAPNPLFGLGAVPAPPAVPGHPAHPGEPVHPVHPAPPAPSAGAGAGHGSGAPAHRAGCCCCCCCCGGGHGGHEGQESGEVGFLFATPNVEIGRLADVSFDDEGEWAVAWEQQAEEFEEQMAELEAELAELELPEVHLLELEFPEVELAELELPEVHLLELEFPEVELAELELFELQLPEMGALGVGDELIEWQACSGCEGGDCDACGSGDCEAEGELLEECEESELLEELEWLEEPEGEVSEEQPLRLERLHPPTQGVPDATPTVVRFDGVPSASDLHSTLWVPTTGLAPAAVEPLAGEVAELVEEMRSEVQSLREVLRALREEIRQGGFEEQL